jgi:hypothetical protein
MPPFTDRGNLPPGIWPMSWSELWAVYGYNNRRANLLSGLRLLLIWLDRAGCDSIYLGGSFITDRERPNDIDGCFDGMTIDLSLLDPVFQDIDEQKIRFGCELRIDFMSQLQGFLQKDRDGNPIGIVALQFNITDLQP